MAEIGSFSEPMEDRFSTLHHRSVVPARGDDGDGSLIFAPRGTRSSFDEITPTTSVPIILSAMPNQSLC